MKISKWTPKYKKSYHDQYNKIRYLHYKNCYQNKKKKLDDSKFFREYGKPLSKNPKVREHELKQFNGK